MVDMNLSASAFLWGCRGVIFLCLKPIYSDNLAISCTFKGGPLSIFMTHGTLNMENTLSRCGMTDLADVEETISTTMYLE